MLSLVRIIFAVAFASNLVAVDAAPAATTSSCLSQRPSTTTTKPVATSMTKATTTSTRKPTTTITKTTEPVVTTSSRSLVTTKTTSSTPVPVSTSTTCKSPVKRIEWRQLSKQQKADYISSVKCLMTKPSKLGLQTSRYEDFAYVHAQLNIDVHFVAQFLPWHRYFTFAFETALRQTCAYTGPMPYWDWSLDHASPSTSPIWSATDGFGGNGNGTGFQSPSRPGPLLRCVVDGPFKDFRPTYRDTRIEQHCLNRAWNDFPISADVGRMQGAAYTPDKMSEVASQTSFDGFWRMLENGPHGAVHQGISGDMGPSTSPNDPIFFVHHANIDRVWWLWQQADVKGRLNAYGGNKDIAGNVQASLSDVMQMKNLVADLKVGEVMSTTAGPLCYTY